MSTALYRRYRPDTFAEVIGQEHVTGPLSAALDRNRVSHAYLFSGPRGCGKTTSARILARCLNCEQGPTATPCGVCDSCVALARGGPGSIDVIEIDAASHRGIDDAREIRDRAIFAPASSRFKIFIIDEAHMVTKEGFNALLKIVEEPPEHVKFVFATTEPDKVIGTIRSRTHHYPFRLVPPGPLQDYLGQLATSEGVEIGPGVLPLVVRAGGGSVRDTLSVLDQLIAGAGAEGVTYPLAISLLGYTDAALLDDVVEAIAAGDGRTAFQMVERVIDSGLDPRRFVEDLLERLRDLLVVAAVPDGAHAVLRGLPSDQLQRMAGQSGAFGAAELSRAADVTNAALTDMTGATSPRLHLELLVARLLLPGADDAQRGLPARLDRLERRIGMSGGVPLAAAAPRVAAPAPVAPVSVAPVSVAPVSVAPVSAPPAPAPVARPADPVNPAASEENAGVSAAREHGTAAAAARAGALDGDGPSGPAVPAADFSSAPTPSAPAPSPAAPSTPASAPAAAVPAAAGAMDVAALRAAWPGVLETLRPMKRATWALLTQDAQVLRFDGKHLVLGFSSPGLASSFARGSHQDLLRQALSAHLGLDCSVEGVSGAAAPAAAAPGRSAAPASPAPASPAPAPPAPGRPATPSGPGAQPAAGQQSTQQPVQDPTAWPEVRAIPTSDPGPGGTGASSPVGSAPAPAGASAGPAAAARPGPTTPGPTTPSPADAPAAAPASPASAPAQAGVVQASVPEQHAGPAGQQRPPVVDLRSEQPVAAGAARHAGAPTGRAAAPARRSAPPVDDIPLPDEPPPDDTPPPPDDWTPARRPAPSGPQPVQTQPVQAQPVQSQPARPTQAQPTHSQPSHQQPSQSAQGARASAAMARAAVRAPAQSAQAPATAAAVEDDDEPSRDDVEVEGSGLVGAAVVSQLLGGTVIEELHQ